MSDTEHRVLDVAPGEIGFGFVLRDSYGRAAVRLLYMDEGQARQGARLLEAALQHCVEVTNLQAPEP